jgi:outer membrane protein assembly factor BamB
MKKTVFVSMAGLAVTMALLSATAPALADMPNPDCLPDSVCPEWTTRYDAAALYDHAFDIVTSSDGARVYVTGASTSTAGGLDYLTIAYNAGTGQQLWIARYDSPNHGADAPAGASALGTAIAISADGNRIFVSGYSADMNGKYDYLTIAYNAADGVEAWTSHYSTPQESQATALALSGDGQRLCEPHFPCGKAVARKI